MSQVTAWLIVATVALNTVTIFFLTLSVNSLIRVVRNRTEFRVENKSGRSEKILRGSEWERLQGDDESE